MSAERKYLQYCELVGLAFREKPRRPYQHFLTTKNRWRQKHSSFHQISAEKTSIWRDGPVCIISLQISVATMPVAAQEETVNFHRQAQSTRCQMKHLKIAELLVNNKLVLAHVQYYSASPIVSPTIDYSPADVIYVSMSHWQWWS